MRSYKTKYNMLSKMLFIFILSILIFLLCTLMRGLPIGRYFNPIYISSTFGFIAYFELTHKTCHKYSQSILTKHIILCIIIGLLVLQLPCRIIAFHETAITLSELNCQLLGILLAYFSYKKHLKTWLARSIGLCFILSIYTNLFISKLI